MKIRRIKLFPFGGIGSDELSLREGLNVVLGPNEAGKSTFHAAVLHALFVPTKIDRRNKSAVESMQAFIPVGGNSSAVELDFMANGNEHVITKNWGEQSLSRLNGPGGMVIQSDDEIQRYLESILPVPEGTIRNVLMASQGALARTLDLVNGDADTKRHLDEVLRRSVQETAGISVSEFRQRIEAAFAQYFSRWDTELGLPEGNRGVAKPWVKDVGTILQAYYAKERLRIEFEEAEEHEQKIEELGSRLTALRGDLQSLRQYVHENSAKVEAARERQVVEARLQGTRAEINEIKKANDEWPKLEATIEAGGKEMPEMAQQIEALDTELKAALAQESGKPLCDACEKATIEKDRLDKLQSHHESLKAITEADVDNIRTAQTSLENLKTRAAAARMSLELYAKTALCATLTSDAEAPVDISVEQGETRALEAVARLEIETPDMKLTVASGGQESAQKLINDLQTAERKLNALLDSHGVASVDEAISASREYERSNTEIAAQEQKLAMLTGKLTFENLTAQVAAMGPQVQVRQSSVVATEKANLSSKMKSVQTGVESCRKQIEEFTAKFGSKDELFLRVADSIRKTKDLEGQLQKLSNTNETTQDPAAMIAEYENKKSQQEQVAEDERNHSIELTALEGEGPERSAEEIAREYQDAQAQFDKALRRGGAIARIREIDTRLKTGTTQPLYANLVTEFVRIMQLATGGKYGPGIDASSDNLPDGLMNGAAQALAFELLSAGTKDTFALVLRLAMAGCLLDGKEGFFFLDDPLVDMDPERQAFAAEAIREFSIKHQVVVFTCHPAHAELLAKDADIRKISDS